MERFLENTMYASRWLLAPIYLGLSLALLALTLKFFQELDHLVPHIFEQREADLILVLQDGRITEQGTHDQLIHSGGLYSKIFNIQSALEEEFNEEKNGYAAN